MADSRSYAARLDKLNEVMERRTLPKHVQGIMDYDERGQPAEFQMQGSTFKPLPPRD